MTHKLNFGRHQLTVSLGRKRGRPNKPLAAQSSEFISYLIKIGTNKRLGGHPISRVLRRLIENKRIRQAFSANLVVFTLFAGIATPSISAFTDQTKTEIVALNPSVTQLTTENSIRKPLDSFKISQGYHLFHRAIDLNEVTGAPVYPIMDGVVEQVVYRRFGYGNLVMVDHGTGFKSLYAHLNKIIAKPGEEVDKGTVLGTVGATGRATGSHLHLEVYDDGQLFNPLTILK